MRLLIVVIVVVSVLALIATLGAVVVGSWSFEGVVVDKPYETGLAWDEARRNREQLGWKVSVRDTLLRIGKNDLFVTVMDKNGALLTNAIVDFTITRPSTRAYDRIYRTVTQTPGRYHALIDLPVFGAWNVKIDVIKDKNRADFDTSIYAENSAP